MSESDIERINKTSMDRLTEKLRRRVDHMINMEASHTKTLEWEAADEITRLRAEVEKLKAALRVYAGPVGGDNFPHWSDGYPGGVMVEWNTIDFGDAARAALEEKP